MTSGSVRTAPDAARSGVGVVGEDTEAPGRVVNAMLRLAQHFPLTTATDLALAGYDVLGYVPLDVAAGVISGSRSPVKDGHEALIGRRAAPAPRRDSHSPVGAS